MYKEAMSVYSIRVDSDTVKEVERIAKVKKERPRTFAKQALIRGLEIIALEIKDAKRTKSGK
jgi:predicted transcriptional regulator